MGKKIGTIETFYTANQIRSRLGISTIVLDGQVPLGREAIKLIAKAGIVTIEIIDRREDYQEEEPSTMQGIVAACRELGISITSFHSRSINFHKLGVDLEIERSKRMINHLLDIGRKIWGTHDMIEYPETRSGFERLAKHYEGQDLKLVIENGGPRQGVQECIEWIDAIDSPQIGMIFDVGHEQNASGQNPMTIPGEPTKILRNIGHRLHHIHLHDSVEGRDHFPPFEGEIQWVETFKGLKEICYPGAFIFEVQPSPDFADTIRKVGTVPERMEEMIRQSQTKS